MSSFSTFLATNIPWDLNRLSVLSRVDSQHGIGDETTGKGPLTDAFKDALISVLQNPNRLHLLKFYHHLLNTEIDPLFKIVLDRDPPQNPFMGSFLVNKSPAHFFKEREHLFESIPTVDQQTAAVLGEWLARYSPDRGPVKWGLLLLGYYRNYGCKDILLKLGAHEDFTLFAVHALKSLYPNCEEILWSLAKRAKNEGREIAAQELKDTKSSEIKRWMLYEGLKDCANPSYHLASIFAKTGGVYQKLRVSEPDFALLEGALLIIAGLLRVPGAKMDHYPYEKEVVELVLQQLLTVKPHAEMMTTLYEIQRSILKIQNDLSPEWTAKGWTKLHTGRCLKTLDALLADSQAQPRFRKLSCALAEKPACLVFHPAQPHIYIGDQAGSITCFDLLTGNEISHFQTGPKELLAIGFYREALYSFDTAFQLKKWDVKTGACLESYSIPARPEPAAELAYFIPNTPILVVSDHDLFGPLQIDIEKGCQTGRYELNSWGEGHEIVSYSSSRDASQLSAFMLNFYGSWGPTDFHVSIENWSVRDCSHLFSYQANDYSYRSGDRHKVFPRHVFAPDGKKLLYTLEGELVLLEISQDDEDQKEYIGYWEVTEIDWSPVSNLIAFGRKTGEKTGGQLCLLDVSTKKILYQEQLFKHPIENVKFSPDGRYLAVFSTDLQVAVYTLA